MKKVYIMRGASSSGKSTWVKNNLRNALVISADNYFMINGVYTFDPRKLSENHNKCLIDYLDALQDNVELIVVDNTNTKVFEVAPYYRLAEAFGYAAEIVWVVSTPEYCKSHNPHGTPENIIDQMFSGVEPIPHWWKFRIVLNG